MSQETDKVTLDYFLEQQARDPEFLPRWLARLTEVWDSLPPAERDAIATAQQLIYPEDVESRGRSTAAMLLAGQLLQQIREAQELNQLLELPLPTDDSASR